MNEIFFQSCEKKNLAKKGYYTFIKKIELEQTLLIVSFFLISLLSYLFYVDYLILCLVVIWIFMDYLNLCLMLTQIIEIIDYEILCLKKKMMQAIKCVKINFK